MTIKKIFNQLIKERNALDFLAKLHILCNFCSIFFVVFFPPNPNVKSHFSLKLDK